MIKRNIEIRLSKTVIVQLKHPHFQWVEVELSEHIKNKCGIPKSSYWPALLGNNY